MKRIAGCNGRGRRPASEGSLCNCKRGRLPKRVGVNDERGQRGQEGVVVQAAGKEAGIGLGTSGWRKLNFSEGI